MWSSRQYKIVIEDDPIIIAEYKKYLKTHYIGEDYPFKGCLNRDDWSNLPIEQFCRFIREQYNAVKVVRVEFFNEEAMQLTYYLNHKYEGSKHTIYPRYLLGKYGDGRILFKPISFDLGLLTNS